MKFPYLSCWTYNPSFVDIQNKLMDDGYSISPWINLPNNYEPVDYDLNIVKNVIFYGAPLSLIATPQPEYWLTKKVHPLEDVQSWSKFGSSFIKADFDPILQKTDSYIISNNEQPKLRWKDATKDSAYLAKFGETNPEATRQILQSKYNQLYSNLLKGIGRHSTCVGYNAFTPGFLGRYVDWEKYSYHTEDNLNPWLNAWNGASIPYYCSNGATDYTLWSTQVELMNLVEEIDRVRGSKTIELSIWNGGPLQESMYKILGQNYNTDRYRGWATYGLWLARPEILRVFYPHKTQFNEVETYFRNLLDITEQTRMDVFNNFWSSGTLMKFGSHPYVYGKPTNWNAYQYMELPPYNKPVDLHQPIDVFYLILKKGSEYLIYGHAPLGPVVKTIMVDEPRTFEFTPRGSFYVVSELVAKAEAL